MTRSGSRPFWSCALGLSLIRWANSRRNRSIACRNSSVRRLISSLGAPRSIASLRRSWAARNCCSAVRQVSVLDLERHRPEPIRHIDQGLVATCSPETVSAEPQPHEHAPLRREAVRLDQQGVERDLDVLAIIRAQDDVAALLHERLCEGIEKGVAAG